MVKKGSITVFLALTLGLILSLLSSGLESARMAAARTQILNGMDVGLYSLFGQYNKYLLKDYDLFAVDGAHGGKEMNLAAIYDNLEAYMRPVMNQNSQKLSVQQGGISGYLLMTDSDGEVFYRQAVQYMKDTLGSHGAALLLDKMRSTGRKTEEAENKGNELEEKRTIENYESEMSSAQEKSQEAFDEMKKEEQGTVDSSGFSDGTASSGTGERYEPAQVENPIPAIRNIRRMGILDLVVPPWKAVSDKKADRKGFVSGRKLKSGFAMEDSVKTDSSVTSQMLYQQYLMEKLGNYMKPGQGDLEYQIEYIINGKDSDEENLRAIANKLLRVREGINMAGLIADPVKMSQVTSVAAAIAASFLIPPAAAVIKSALILCWTFAESVLDVRELFDGGKVPVVKSAEDWQLSLRNLPALFDSLDTVRRTDEKGASYEDYLQIFLFSCSKAKKINGGMDMVENSVRKAKNWDWFRLDHCITALEASVDVRANKRKTFTVTRAYHYI